MALSFAMTKPSVILSDVAFAAVQVKASNGGHRKSGKHERIRNTLEGDGLPQPFTRLRDDEGRGNGLPHALRRSQ